MKPAARGAKPVGQAYKDKSKPADIRQSNINAAKGECGRGHGSYRVISMGTGAGGGLNWPIWRLLVKNCDSCKVSSGKH